MRTPAFPVRPPNLLGRYRPVSDEPNAGRSRSRSSALPGSASASSEFSRAAWTRPVAEIRDLTLCQNIVPMGCAGRFLHVSKIRHLAVLFLGWDSCRPSQIDSCGFAPIASFLVSVVVMLPFRQ